MAGGLYTVSATTDIRDLVSEMRTLKLGAHYPCPWAVSTGCDVFTACGHG